MLKRLAINTAVLLTLGCFVAGCGKPPTPKSAVPADAKQARPTVAVPADAKQARPTVAVPADAKQARPTVAVPADAKPATNDRLAVAGTAMKTTPPTPKSAVPADAKPARPTDDNAPRVAGGRAEGDAPAVPGHRFALPRPPDAKPDAESKFIANVPRMKIDQSKAAAEGIRKLTGQRLTLYTDLPSSPQIDRLPELFDQAFPQWCKYFGIQPADHPDWHLTGFLMDKKAAFVRAGLLPDDLPPFKHGYARNYELWLYDQPSDYYRRHLLLHEGTHGFMNTLLGACGPPWYMEGIAELFATHRLKDGRLTLNYIPADRRETPYWGRIRIIKDAVAAGRLLPLKQVIEYPPDAHLKTEPYAWCWAAAVLLDRHPKYRDRFRELYKNVLKRDFTERFYQTIGDDWGELCEQWQVFVAGVEYGHDIAATAVDFTPGKPLPVDGTIVTISAQRGWQNTGVRLEDGTKYRLNATGRYQVADRPQPWWCEPGGVSIRYYRGRPLGVLLAAVRPDQADKEGFSALLHPTVVGLGTTLAPEHSGTLFLKINDSPAELGDNAGTLTVKIARE